MQAASLTQNIAQSILTTSLFGNIGLQPEIDESQVLDRIVLRAEAAKHCKSFPFMYVEADAVENVRQLWQWESLRRHKIAVKLESCSKVSQ
jgi:hypothetical protein